MSRDAPSANGKTLGLSFSLYPGDDELIKYIQDKIGCSRSEAVRSAIRTYAALLARTHE